MCRDIGVVAMQLGPVATMIFMSQNRLNRQKEVLGHDMVV